jgi:hypothetical protein
VDLGPSGRVENVVGGGQSDELDGGSANNTLSGGPGGSDYLGDLGGDRGLAVSNDTYKGFVSEGSDTVEDYGGTSDRLDLRPLESTGVTYDARNYDSNDATGSNGNESLLITINGQSEVKVKGHFAPYVVDEVVSGTQSGRIEQIVFSNETVTSGEVTSPRKKK